MSKNETRQLGPLAVRASLAPKSVNTTRRTVDVTWSTGAKVLRSNWLNGAFFEELSMEPKHVRMGRLTSGTAPFLADHDGSSVARTLGVVLDARISNGQGIATVRFAAEGIDPTADMVWRKIVDGVIQNVSVGYRTYKVEKTESVDQKIPTLRAIDWEPYEISAVAMGADDGAGIRNEASTNACVFITTNRSEKMEPKVDETDDIVRAERERVEGIKHAVRSAKLGDDFAQKMINGGKSLGDARGMVLDVLAARDMEIPTETHRAGMAITAGETSDEKFARGVESALLMRAVPDLVRQAKAAKLAGFDAIDTGPSEFRGMSLVELARASLERTGVRARSLSRVELVGKALTHRASTSDFPVLFENALGKVLLAAYQLAPDTWSRVCRIESVGDFREVSRYRTGSFGVLSDLPENAEYTHAAIPDGEKLSISTATKGRMISISRQALINDDLGALTGLGTQLGRAAKLSIEVDFYNLLLQNGGLGPTVDGNPFFDAAHANVGAGAALTAASIDADRVVLGSQRDAQSNEYLDLRPAVLLVPLSLGGQAKILNASAVDPDGSKINLPNRVQGLFGDIVDSPRITGTRRYMFASPAIAPAFVAVFLDGQQAPFLESKDGWTRDGTEMKVRLDYKVLPFDVRGAVTNAGTP